MLHGYVQVERAYNAPLVAQMGLGSEPDPRNITNPRQVSFNAASWEAVVEEVSAHKIGGLRFTSYRCALCLQHKFQRVRQNSDGLTKFRSVRQNCHTPGLEFCGWVALPDLGSPAGGPKAHHGLGAAIRGIHVVFIHMVMRKQMFKCCAVSECWRTCDMRIVHAGCWHAITRLHAYCSSKKLDTLLVPCTSISCTVNAYPVSAMLMIVDDSPSCHAAASLMSC